MISSLLLTIKDHNMGASNSGYYYVIYDDISAIFQLVYPGEKCCFLSTNHFKNAFLAKMHCFP